MALVYTVRSAYANFQGLVRFGCINHRRRRLSLLNLKNLARCSPSKGCFDHCCSDCIGLRGVWVRPSACKGWARAWSWPTGAQNDILRIFLTVHRSLIHTSGRRYAVRHESRTIQKSRSAVKHGPVLSFIGLLGKKPERFVACCYYITDLSTEPVLLSMPCFQCFLVLWLCRLCGGRLFKAVRARLVWWTFRFT